MPFELEAPFFLFRNDNLVLTVKRGEYRGLPGGIPRQNEPPYDYALRIMPEFANLGDLGWWWVRSEERGEWDNTLVRLSVFEFPSSSVVSLKNSGTEWTDIGRDDQTFDVTIRIARKIPRR